MIRKTIAVTSELGIHARPSSLLAQTAAAFRSEFRIIQGDRVVDGKSILGIMSLAAECGAVLTLEADGPTKSSCSPRLPGTSRTSLPRLTRRAPLSILPDRERTWTTARF